MLFLQGKPLPLLLSKILKLNTSRITEAKKLNLCTNCLRIKHTNQCKGQCKKCGKAHNTILHIDDFSKQNIHTKDQIQKGLPQNQNHNLSLNQEHNQNEAQGFVQGQHLCMSNTPEVSDSVTEKYMINTHCSENNCQGHSKSTIMLGTANILIRNNKNNFIHCRALLDGGSQSNFISKDLRKNYNWRQINIHIQL